LEDEIQREEDDGDEYVDTSYKIDGQVFRLLAIADDRR